MSSTTAPPSHPYFIIHRLIEYGRLIRSHRPIGTYLLLWPTLIALWIAGNGAPSFQLIIIFTLGAFFMRSAGCAINDYFDKDFDGKVKRTCERPLAKGTIRPKEALLVFGFFVGLSFLLVLQTNILTIKLSFIAFLLATLYPLMKRYTHFPQIVLGAAFAWAIPMAYAAQMNQVPMQAWLLYFATLFWAVAYDTLYAMADSVEDKKIGIKSTALFFGTSSAKVVAFSHGITLLCLILFGLGQHFGISYFLGLCLASLLGAYQQTIIKKATPEVYLKAFFNNHWMGLIVFVSVILTCL